jgi:TPR repeat protein
MAADKSETQALWHSARRYALGDGVEFDWEKAVHLLKETASLALSEGNPDYAFQLGRILTTGIYYSDAEDEVGSDAEGQLCLPPCPTVPVDEAEAEIWFRRASDAGHA